MIGDLTDRVAIVTGGGRGLGEGICRSLAAAGASVAVVGRSKGPIQRVAEDLTSIGASSIAVRADVSDERSVEAMTERTVEAFGRIDILVNNAAIYPRRAWTEIEPEDWDRVLAVNLKGCFLCARAAFPYMERTGRGRIINVSSVNFFTGRALLLDYGSSKGGIIGFTRSLAREVGPQEITVNAISPGAFPTEAEKIHSDQEAWNKWVLDQQSLKRRGNAEDIGNLATFLASDAASFITGQTIEIDGGRVMH